MKLLEVRVSSRVKEGTSVIASASFTVDSPGAPGTPQGGPEGAEKALPWTVPLLMSWAGLLGRSTENHSRAEALPAGTEETREKGEGVKGVWSWRMVRVHWGRNLHSTEHSKSLAAGQ